MDFVIHILAALYSVELGEVPHTQTLCQLARLHLTISNLMEELRKFKILTSLLQKEKTGEKKRERTCYYSLLIFEIIL